MEFAVNIPTSGGSNEYSTLPYCDTINWHDQQSYAVTAESVGFDGVAVPDHLMTGDGATTECLLTLAGIAGVTDSVYLYPKTINNILRHPPLLAKSLATLDSISEGRLRVGMGAGWKEDEAIAYGYDWPGAPDRLREMEETIELFIQLWTTDRVSYDGEYVSVTDACCLPHPIQTPHPPIMVGGGGEEFTLRIAAKHADIWNFWGPTAVMEHKLSVLKRHCETYDREYNQITKSWFARCLIRETEAEVKSLLKDVPRFHPDSISETEFALVGTPTQVESQLRSFLSLGISEIVLEFVDFPETDGISLFAETVLKNIQS
ncbi:LLM class flavin-dependent oxidoreductase [Halalkalirubrum salinum]|uniref:LLM class flavin-dependent oxidoreductase n=1 Tax=Halalkalirubrum salinum TaxID=2563889 RepID=UPI0010FB9DFB|nr:LLM class flavin-dependent oxidoreductase [Halalkalirubrum salinum]